MTSSISKKRWFEGGTGDRALDLARRNIVPDQEPNPRPSDGMERATMSAEVDLDVTIYDPLQVMIECEEQDEAVGCKRGTHFNERIRRYADTH